jgi:hypothetical protein
VKLSHDRIRPYSDIRLAPRCSSAIASTLGPNVTIEPARRNPAAAIHTSASAPASVRANAADASSPICSEVRRPSTESARWPQIGFSTTRATAIAAITTPISLPERPLPSR